MAKELKDKQKVNKFLVTFKENRQKILLFSVIILATIGTILLIASSASTFSIALEAESGQLSGCAKTITDSNASGTGTNRAISFGTSVGCSTPPAGENTFTLASIPDTQAEMETDSNFVRFNNRAQWIINNKTSQNIKYVWQVGDLQDWDDATHSHYERASKGLKTLEQAGVPYSLAVGNHDTKAVCYPGSACPGVDVPTVFRDIPTWDQYYPPSRYPGIKTLCAEFDTFSTRLMAVGPTGTGVNTPSYIKKQCQTRDSTVNAYRTFTAGGLKWVIINFEMWPRQSVQEWVKTVLERYPDHNAILLTHMFLSDGSTNLSTGSEYGSPQGTPKKLYDNVISQYANVRFVFSGHTGTSGCAVFTGAKGNKIYSYLNNRLESISPIPNHLRLMKFDINAKTVTSQMYVPQSNTTLTQASNCNASGVNWVR